MSANWMNKRKAYNIKWRVRIKGFSVNSIQLGNIAIAILAKQ